MLDKPGRVLLANRASSMHPDSAAHELETFVTMLDRITPVILTYNEEPNIGRTLERLRWARDIVIVDSFSTDKTVEIVKSFPQARLFQRKFDSHAKQWNFATCETGVASDWILAMDADYIVPDQAIDEIEKPDPAGPVDGYTAAFRYCVWGKPLRGALYPPVTVLYRRGKGSFLQDGNTQRLKLDGTSRFLNSKLLHDDRKPLSHWLAAPDMKNCTTRLALAKWWIPPLRSGRGGVSVPARRRSAASNWARAMPPSPPP